MVRLSPISVGHAAAIALGLDPNRIKADSLLFEPIGDQVLVTWTGMRLIEPEEMARVITATREVD